MQFYPTLDSDSIRPYLPAHPMLLPASSWSRQLRGPQGALPVPHIPAQVPEIAADSGGFAAALRAKKLGLEDGYSYTPEQYVEWLLALGPRLSWAATFDYCGSNDRQVLREYQARTTDMAWRFWRCYRQTGIVWVPTLQGWLPADYQQHTREMRPLLEQMARHYGPQSTWRVGIGTLCQRSAEMVCQICTAVADELPGIPLHAWGLSLRMVRSPMQLPSQVRSFDSSSWAWRYGRDMQEWRASGLSQRRWSVTVALPAYLAAVDCAWASPKQLMLPLKAA